MYLEVSCDHSGTERRIGQVLRLKNCPILPKNDLRCNISLFHRPGNPNLFWVDSIPDFLLYQEKGKRSQSCSVKRSLFYLVEEEKPTDPSHEIGNSEDISKIPRNSYVRQQAIFPQLFYFRPSKSLHILKKCATYTTLHLLASFIWQVHDLHPQDDEQLDRFWKAAPFILAFP